MQNSKIAGGSESSRGSRNDWSREKGGKRKRLRVRGKGRRSEKTMPSIGEQCAAARSLHFGSQLFSWLSLK